MISSAVSLRVLLMHCCWRGSLVTIVDRTRFSSQVGSDTPVTAHADGQLVRTGGLIALTRQQSSSSAYVQDSWQAVPRLTNCRGIQGGLPF